jgi:hypothetical protein
MGPKVEAAWHLHELLPDLDFFVSLGSMLGVGGRAGQSLYGGTSVSHLFVPSTVLLWLGHFK